ncbi:MAG: CoA transferase [Acidimicrobiia bacterium]|nr:CoA transferase [Acidimicrobiia bacterium]
MQEVVVVEVAGDVSGAWCGRLLSQLGAEVVLVEPPQGSGLRTRPPLLPNGESPWHHWLNGGKVSVTAPDEHRLEDLAAAADCVVYTASGREVEEVAALAERLRTRRPAQVFAALSPFGLTGPWRSLASSELTDWAAGGHLYLTGDADREPIQGGGPWPQYVAGANAVIAIQTALLQAGRTGHGQLLDISTMEAMAGAHQWTITTYTHHGYVKRRDGNRLAESYHPLGIVECADGWVQLACASNEHWDALCVLTDSVELLAEDDLLIPAGRYDRADEIDAAISPWFADRAAVDAVAALQEVRVPASLVNDLHAVLADEQLSARHFWQEVPALGEQARLPAPAITLRPRPDHPAPAPAAPDPGPTEVPNRLTGRPAATLPDLDLSGVRVLEFSVAWAGPLAGRYLADLGADVIKIEHPTSRGLGVIPGGVAKGWSWGELPPASVRNGTWPATDPGERWFNRMGMFNKLQRNKRSLCLDVKAPGGDELLRRLVARSDVVLNNYSPRGVRSLGIDHETLSMVRTDIITVSMSGYGATGPMATHFSLGPILETHAGLASTTGYPDRGPLRIGVAFPDPVGGLSGTIATLAALWRRAMTGEGSAVDLSQLETLLPLIGDQLLATSSTGEMPERLGNRSARHAPQGVYRCGGDDEWLALTVRSDSEWQRLVAVVGDDALDDDRYRRVAGRHEHHDAIDDVLTEWTSVRGKFEVMAALQARGIAAVPVLTNADLVDGPQLQSRGFIAAIHSDDAGHQRLPGCPLHFADRDIPLGPAPTLGQHNADIATGLLGYDEADVAKLIADGTLATAPPD